MIGTARSLILASAVLSAACGAPSSYDGLTGGSKTDSALVAPRPMSPLSVTMVATSHPRFKWELFGKETGAIVELCKTRDFAPGTVRSFDAEGRELVVPEDLEPGIWFWRLKGRGQGTAGTDPSPAWEVLVRGPAARGSSDVPTGSIVDLDGDGHPDLVTAGDTDWGSGVPPVPTIVVFPGTANGTINGDAPQDRGAGYSDNAVFRLTAFASVAGGIDYDGDGFGDLVYAGLTGYQTGPTPDSPTGYDVIFERGGAYDPAAFDVLYLMLPIMPGSSPSVAEGGDIDGDGYGDLLVGDSGTAMMALGGRKGPGATQLLSAAPAETWGRPARMVRGAFDANGDGLSDLLLGPISDAAADPSAGGLHRVAPNSGDPTMSERTVMFALGSDALDIDQARELSMANVPDLRAAAFATGDFDGDGLSDVAASLPVNGAPRVCVWFGDRERSFVPGPCAAGLDGDTALGLSLTAGDIEGDGRDELLATVTANGASEVRVVHFAEGGVTVTPIGQRGFGKHLTTVWPGRPGKARWAALGDDGVTIGLFEGDALAQSISRPRWVVDNFGRALR